jgi:hypothetical protein
MTRKNLFAAKATDVERERAERICRALGYDPEKRGGHVQAWRDLCALVEARAWDILDTRLDALPAPAPGGEEE